MADTGTTIRAVRPIQQSFPLALFPVPVASYESKGVVYTKRWVVDLVLGQAGCAPDKDLVDCVPVEPSAGGGAFWARARDLATRVLTGRGVDGLTAKSLADSWVRTGDYLLRFANSAPRTHSD